MRYYLDCEFIEDGHTIELISIGIVSEANTLYYAENSEVDLGRANDWVKENVVPVLAGAHQRTRQQIADEIIAFIGDDHRPEWWAYYADFDWVVLCQLYGRMVDLPKGWPMFCLDIKQVAYEQGNPQLPEHTFERYGAEHFALNDALWARDAHRWLETRDA